jgi:hypothetical protein
MPMPLSATASIQLPPSKTVALPKRRPVLARMRL